MIEIAQTDQHKALVALCGLCGLRVGEAIQVTWLDFDPLDQVLEVNHGKGEKTREVPLSDTAWFFIRPAFMDAMVALDNRLVPIGDRQARALITQLGESAGLSRRTSSHDLRATFATEVYENTNDLRAVQELLGHSSSKTTEVYTDISMKAMRRAVNTVGGSK